MLIESEWPWLLFLWAKGEEGGGWGIEGESVKSYGYAMKMPYQTRNWPYDCIATADDEDDFITRILTASPHAQIWHELRISKIVKRRTYSTPKQN